MGQAAEEDAEGWEDEEVPEQELASSCCTAPPGLMPSAPVGLSISVHTRRGALRD